MNNNLVKKILAETEEGYDLVSNKFSDTRHQFWPELEFIKNYAKDGGRVLDFGCGNGRLLELFIDKNLEYLGIDPSQKLIDFAREKYADAKFSKLNLGQSSLPLEDNFFNSIYSIAVFHHFPSREYRQKMAKELFRITKKDGHIIITVWNLWPASTRGNDRSSTRGGQRKYTKNIIRNWLNKLLGKSQLDWSDCQISFKNNEGKVFSRFHHAFTKKELQKLFESAGFQTEMCKIIDGRNIIYIGKK